MDPKFLVSLPQHINLSPEWHLTDTCAICCMLLLLQSATSHRKIKCLINEKAAGKGTLFIEHATSLFALCYVPAYKKTIFFFTLYINVINSIILQKVVIIMTLNGI